MADDMAFAQAERRTDRRYLVQVELQRPHRGVMRLVHREIPAAELVVADNPAAFGKIGVRLRVMPGRTRAAVQAQQRQLARRFRVAGYPVPGLIASKRNVTLFNREIAAHKSSEDLFTSLKCPVPHSGLP